ncbi:MAG: methyltransferase domain-containing protein [Deltaproteobacteria bacterium]|nr:methyltransferase domain-containing protein [Deltaproteobacteria bacterium]
MSTTACCSEFYEQDWVRALLDDSFHPGGPALTARTIESLALTRGERVLDLACGTGTTVIELATRGLHATGMDASASSIERARTRVHEARVGDAVSLVVGDVQTMPFADASFDAVLCECALSTFADPAALMRETLRVLRPGGRLGLSDMAVYGELPPDLARLAGPWACVQGAPTVEGYQRWLLDAGFRLLSTADESATLHQMARDLKRKLVVLGLGQVTGVVADQEIDVAELRTRLDQARALVDAGTVQYVRVAASRGRPQVVASPEPDAEVEPAAPQAPSAAPCDPSTGCC